MHQSYSFKPIFTSCSCMSLAVIFHFIAILKRNRACLRRLSSSCSQKGGFEGGALVVHHGRTTKTFDFSLDSATKFFCTVFYADCEHELQRVTSGKRLCLSFNLVRGNDSVNRPLEGLKGCSARLSRVELALHPWLKALSREEPLMEGDIFFNTYKLAIPLEHKYTKKNLSFSGLKGNDLILAQALNNCGDASGSRWFDLHLCILTLHKVGMTEDDGFNFNSDSSLSDADSEDSDSDDRQDVDYGMIQVDDESGESSTWIGTNNKPCNFIMGIDDKREVVINEDVQKMVFDENRKPDEMHCEKYTGNAGPTLEYWYHKAMVVIWPWKNWVSMACDGGMCGALDILEAKAEEGDPHFVTMLHEVLTYCEGNRGKAFINAKPRYHGSVGKNIMVARIVKLCLEVGRLEDVIRVLRFFSKPFPSGDPIED